MRLRDLRTELSDTLERLARESDAADRLAEQHVWTRRLAEALELPWDIEARDVDDELTVPLLAELTDGAGKPLPWLLEALPVEASDANPLTLEHLREMELVELVGETGREGHYQGYRST